MEYFLWCNNYKKFWKPNSRGYTACVHTAGRYSVEYMRERLNGHTLDWYRPCPAPELKYVEAAVASETGYMPTPDFTPRSKEPLFRLWDADDCYWWTYTPHPDHFETGTLITHRAGLFTADEVNAILTYWNDPETRPASRGTMIVPCRAGPLEPAYQEFMQLVREAA